MICPVSDSADIETDASESGNGFVVAAVAKAIEPLIRRAMPISDWDANEIARVAIQATFAAMTAHDHIAKPG